MKAIRYTEEQLAEVLNRRAKGGDRHRPDVSNGTDAVTGAAHPKKRGKYNAQPTDVCGMRFASKKEAARWNTLKLLQTAKKIKTLERQVRYSLDVEGRHICDYIADFSYWDRVKECAIIEDVKGMRRGAAYDLFRLKARLFAALFKIEVTEI